MFSGAVFATSFSDIACRYYLATPRFRKQAKDFQIEPDERDHQAKCAVPLQNKIERRDDHDEKAKADADGAAAIDGGHLNVKEAQRHFCEVEDSDAAGRGDDAQLESLGRANHAALVREQHDKQHAEGNRFWPSMVKYI
jgi:hypothetical protein